MIETLFKSWKTTVAGVAVLAMTYMFARGLVTADQYVMVLGTLAGGGFVLAKDSNVSGSK